MFTLYAFAKQAKSIYAFMTTESQFASLVGCTGVSKGHPAIHHVTLRHISVISTVIHLDCMLIKSYIFYHNSTLEVKHLESLLGTLIHSADAARAR